MGSFFKVKMFAFSSLVFLISLSRALADHDIPAFIAKGHVSTEMLHSSDTNYFIKKDGSFLFSYNTNGIWQVQFTYLNFSRPNSMPSKIKMGTVIDCKRIPDGIREIITPPNDTNNPSATTATNPFPAMARQELFLPWLSLCPKPELPMVNSNFIHFDFRPETFSNPNNQGRFKLNYIEPNKQFLSELIVTNNGKALEFDGSFVELPAPYNNGYVQFAYRVLETTNVDGMNYPFNVVLYQYAPLPTGKTSEDVYPAVISRLNVSEIDTGGDRLKLSPVSALLIALDSRPKELSNGVTINYGVSNDQWLALTNKRIKQLANMYKSQSFLEAKDEQGHSRNRIVILCVLGISSLVPIGLIIKHNKNKQTHE